jgi:two-component system chemotaxis response regulator CheB
VIRLLVVDDSPLMRRLLGELFTDQGDFEVAFARNGVEALAALDSAQPDVITLDVQMPEMDGLTCLDRIMLRRPTPVVMASSLTTEGASEALRAIELGAVDVIAKPAGAVSLRMDVFGPAIVEKVRAAAAARLPASLRLRERLRARAAGPRVPAAAPPPLRLAARSGGGPADRVVLVGASTGGPPALDVLLGALPADFPWPIVIAQHMPQTFTAALARRLDGLTALSVSEVREPTPLMAGHVYVGRGDADILLTRRGGALAALGAPASALHRWHPSVSRLVESALEVLPASALVGVLMTGMGDDGAHPMTRMSRDGGLAFAQSEATSVVWGMPGALVRAGGATAVCDLEDLAAALLSTVTAA